MRRVRALGIDRIQKGVFLHDWERELCFRALGGWLRKTAFFFSYSSFLLLLPSSLRDRRWVEGISGATSEFFFPFVSRFFNLGLGHLDSR